MKKQASDMDRRQMLKTLAAGATVGAAATLSTSASAAEPKVAAENKSSGYRETDHIRNYYASLSK
ncbi:formate dehydrogenase [Shewanella intestini]|uniref:Formate dehydrogenase n=1 Tax=Shewanella intestini TaxID=2017544 RepID=A0ABS5I5K3_9GAMM|nr:MULTISPECIES: formate dehydrogenase [Shewanella]MBR9729309.1 formate dehydrogenase [Shewanella intestini]MRG37388.1 formate dehydrogenase [Shewanella sp. XMDDZSB0408]